METGSSKYPKLPDKSGEIPEKLYEEIDERLGSLVFSAAEIVKKAGYLSGDPAADAENGVLAIKNGVSLSEAKALQSVQNLKAFVGLRDQAHEAFFKHLATLKKKKPQLVSEDVELAFVFHRFGLADQDSTIARFTPEAKEKFEDLLSNLARLLLRAIDTREAVKSNDVENAYWQMLSRRWGKAVHRGWALTGFISIKAVGALLLAGIGTFLFPAEKIELMLTGGLLLAFAESLEKWVGLWERRT